ncbi:MAG: DUF3347 domain-containing protein [Bdellovibrionales bacterium]|nr:DUF3347 domain-containing protein [Bdellovibrionales bacterium]
MRSQIFSVVLALLALSPVAVFGHQGETSFKKILPSYLAIQNALASDALAKAKTAAEELKTASSKLQGTDRDHAKELAAASSLAGEISKAAKIEDARASFKKLSDLFITDLGKNPDSGTEVVSCSMANAKWIQKKGEIRNPYYGKEMLACGERS